MASRLVSSGVWKLEGMRHGDRWQEEELILVKQRNKKILKKKKKIFGIVERLQGELIKAGLFLMTFIIWWVGRSWQPCHVCFTCLTLSGDFMNHLLCDRPVQKAVGCSTGGICWWNKEHLLYFYSSHFKQWTRGKKWLFCPLSAVILPLPSGR